MAHEWYVQHNGKLYGPLTSANLKKLAAEGKVSPSTNVRSGTEGNWVPAGRVQGLFAASATEVPAAAKAPAPTAAPPRQQVTPPPIVPPVAPPVARPVARVPLGSFVPKAQPAAAPAGSMAAKIIGAVSLVFGILSLAFGFMVLATKWLPMFDALAWMGIGVGSLGLILGIAGFVISARKQGSGLALNIAGTSSSVVGLVLTVVFGVMFGLFGGKPAPIAVVPTPPPVIVAPEPVPEPEPEAPAPPPEPVWTLAGESIDQPPIKASIASAKIEQVRLESVDLSTLKKSKPQPMLKVVVTIENTTADRIVEVPGWPGGGDLIGTGVSELLGNDAGKALQSATATAKLNDNAGNAYKQVALMSLFGAQIQTADHAVRPGKSKQLELVFPPPLDTIEYLRIELSPAGFTGAEPLRFQIPKEMITGMTAPMP